MKFKLILLCVDRFQNHGLLYNSIVPGFQHYVAVHP